MCRKPIRRHFKPRLGRHILLISAADSPKTEPCRPHGACEFRDRVFYKYATPTELKNPTLPANFVECNGQTISDAASPLNGQTVRNLNTANRFLRGNSTSGGTGGATTHLHSFAGSTDVEDGDGDVQNASGSPITVASFAHTHAFAGSTDSSSSLPPYIDMVWIIRIK